MTTDREKDKQAVEETRQDTPEQARKKRRRSKRGRHAMLEVPEVIVQGGSVEQAVQNALEKTNVSSDHSDEHQQNGVSLTDAKDTDVLDNSSDRITSVGLPPEPEAEGEQIEPPEGPEDKTIVSATPINDDYELVEGPEMSIDDLPPELRDELDLDQQFYLWEHGGPDLDQSAEPANSVEQVETSATHSSPILPGPIDHPVDLSALDLEDSGPKAGVFQLPKNFTLPPEMIAATQAAVSAQIELLPPTAPVDQSLHDKKTVTPPPRDQSMHDRETVAPPTKDQLPLLGGIDVPIETEEEDEITQDVSKQAEILWAFRESRFSHEYERDLANFQVNCLKNPQLVRPNVADYLNRFQQELDKIKGKP